MILAQNAFISPILKRFNMQNDRDVSTPMDPNVKLDLAQDPGENKLKDIKRYQAIVGSLMYAALATWPDISFAVAALCRYNSCPFTSHLTTTNTVLHYLTSTADFRLHCSTSSSTNSNDQLAGYTHHDWANDSSDRKSQEGYVFLLINGALSWQLRKQDLIAMLTLDAEYIAYSEGSREAQWLLLLHPDIHGENTSPLTITCDNHDALTHIITGIINARTTHIDVGYHNCRDFRACKIVDYFYAHTNMILADILTKAFSKDTHEKFPKAMGIW